MASKKKDTRKPHRERSGRRIIKNPGRPGRDGWETARALLDASTESSVLMSADEVVLDMNEVAARRLGGAPEDFIGRHVSELLPSEVYAYRKKRFREAVETGRPVRFEDERDGVRFDLNILPVPGRDGRAAKLALFARDITEQRRLEGELRRKERLYAGIVEDQTELICRFTPDGILTFVNDAYARYFNMAKEDLLGRSFMPLIPDAERNERGRRLRELTPEAPVSAVEHRINIMDGGLRWQQWVDRAVFDEDGALIAYQSVGRDVTERVRAEERLQDAVREKDAYRRRLAAIFQSIPDAIVTVDAEMRIIQANKAWRALVEGGAVDPDDKSLSRVVRSSAHPFRNVLEQTLSTGRPVVEYRAECDLSGRRVLVLNTAVLDDGGDGGHGRADVSGAVLVVRDVTRLAELEDRLRKRSGFMGMLGGSPRMRRVFHLVERLAELDTMVLIVGESGTGKELVAEALHYGSPRSKGPLVKVDCAALSENLLESELFGHVRGAFTGAVRDRVGRIRAAEGGTVFLDEIGDVTPRMQLKLLRFLERREYERVGDSKTLRADVRVVAATNADLEEKMRLGEFREDLYYRLKVMVVDLPPLRERSGDIPLLAAHFLTEFNERFHKHVTGISPQAMQRILNHAWPGNVRELRHVMEHACVLCPAGEIEPVHLPADMGEERPSSAPSARDGAANALVPGVDRRPGPGAGPEDIVRALDAAEWNKTEAARLLGMSRRTIYRKIEQYGLVRGAWSGVAK